MFFHDPICFFITFDVYVVLDIFEKYDDKRPDPICAYARTWSRIFFDWSAGNIGLDFCGKGRYRDESCLTENSSLF